MASAAESGNMASAAESGNMRTETDLLGETLAGLDALEAAATPPQDRLGRAWRTTWPKLAAVGIALALWQLAVWLEWKPRFVLASPGDAFADLWGLARDGTLVTAARITLWRAGQGFAVSV